MLNMRNLVNQIDAMDAIKAGEATGHAVPMKAAPAHIRSDEANRIQDELSRLSDDGLTEKAGFLFGELNDAGASLALIGLKLSLIREILEHRKRARLPMLESMENALYAITESLYQVLSLVKEG